MRLVLKRCSRVAEGCVDGFRQQFEQILRTCFLPLIPSSSKHTLCLHVATCLEVGLSFDSQRINETAHVILELKELRADCQRQSIDGLFGIGEKTAVSLAEILKWWWDMPEEYRIAAGISIPSPMLRRSLQRLPEEMFKAGEFKQKKTYMYNQNKLE